MMLADVGQPVPNIAHAVSVSLPSWKAVVGYEEGQDWVLSKMKTGYPRFFIHLIIQELEGEVLNRYGQPGERVMLFPSEATATRCQSFFHENAKSVPQDAVRLLHLEPIATITSQDAVVLSNLHCCFFPATEFQTAKQVWQHTGDGISSRRGEFCLKAFREGLLQPVDGPPSPPRTLKQDLFGKGPRRYQRVKSQNRIATPTSSDLDLCLNGVPGSANKESDQFVEERFGRNLNPQLAFKVKLAIRRRISGCLGDNSDLDQALQNSPQNCNSRVRGLSEEDVYLYPAGMSAIFNAHRILMARARSLGKTIEKSICFGFPYIDTLKILQKWGPGCQFYGHGTSEDLDDLEKRLESGERFLALFTEFPSNPLLRSPDLIRIRKLADKYDFAVVIDETVGNIININVLPHADVVVSSLTKIFSGDSNVMGGSYVLNPQAKMYQSLKQINETEYEDNYWAEDAVFLERNSRDFISRIERINVNAMLIANILQQCPIVKQVYYPPLTPSRANYDACKYSEGGYGGLLSVTFKEPEQSVAFFDALEVHKGPSLGTNFTLSCPYTVIAHYLEMDWTSQFGVEPDLVRISVGLEEENTLAGIIRTALEAAQRV